MRDPNGALNGFCAAVPGGWHLMGVILAAGGALRWYRDAVAFDERRQAGQDNKDVYDLLLAEAAEIEPGADGLFFLPYLSGERSPHMPQTRRRLSSLIARTALLLALGSGALFGAGGRAEAAPAIGPDAFITAFGERAVAALDATRDDPAARRDRFAELMRSDVDMPAPAKRPIRNGNARQDRRVPRGRSPAESK